MAGKYVPAHQIALILLLGVAWLYAPALNFGLMWDDPQWFGRAAEGSWLEVVGPTADFQFYRPGAMLYNRLFWQADNTFAARQLHWLQLCWHLLNVSLIYAISRRLGVGSWAALAVAGMVALNPFSHQAVAWAAPQQPPTAALQNGAWLAYLAARQIKPGNQRVSHSPLPTLHSPLSTPHSSRIYFSFSLVLFTLALFMQESSVVLAFVPLLFEFLLRPGIKDRRSFLSRLPSSPGRGWYQALAYPLLALGFGLLWLQVPRQAGITGLVFDGQTILYLAQGFIYPLLGRPNGYAPGYAIGPHWLVLLFGLTVGLLGMAAVWQKRGHLATIGLVWAVLGVVPALAGLSYDYVSLAPRLLYYSAPGIALLWVCALWPAASRRHRRLQIGRVLLLAFIAWQSGWMILNFQRLYQVGTEHLAAMLAAIGDADGRYLFVNFPDRYEPKRPPYPLGYWGVTLAPVVVELGDFPAALTGNSPQTLSSTMPWIDAEARTAGPYHVDMRGVIAQPAELYQLAGARDAVYLSRYLPDGRFALQLAGALGHQTVPACRLALFAGGVCLQGVAVTATEETLNLQLTWSLDMVIPPQTTVFVHLGQPGAPPLVQADGDAWHGMLPLADWQSGTLIYDQRTLTRPVANDDLFLQIGLYDWVSGARLPATTPEKRPLANNAYLQAIEP